MKQILGRIDFFDFPELELIKIPVKLDTGAYMNALHCIEAKVKDDILYFKLAKHNAYQFSDKIYKTKKFNTYTIKSSNGHSEQRYAISTSIKIYDQVIETEFTLTDRSMMVSPVLIGRIVLKKFIVDSAKKNLSYKSTQATAGV